MSIPWYFDILALTSIVVVTCSRLWYYLIFCNWLFEHLFEIWLWYFDIWVQSLVSAEGWYFDIYWYFAICYLGIYLRFGSDILIFGFQVLFLGGGDILIFSDILLFGHVFEIWLWYFNIWALSVFLLQSKLFRDWICP